AGAALRRSAVVVPLAGAGAAGRPDLRGRQRAAARRRPRLPPLLADRGRRPGTGLVVGGRRRSGPGPGAGRAGTAAAGRARLLRGAARATAARPASDPARARRRGRRRGRGLRAQPAWPAGRRRDRLRRRRRAREEAAVTALVVLVAAAAVTWLLRVLFIAVVPASR